MSPCRKQKLVGLVVGVGEYPCFFSGGGTSAFLYFPKKDVV